LYNITTYCLFYDDMHFLIIFILLLLLLSVEVDIKYTTDSFEEQNHFMFLL